MVEPSKKCKSVQTPPSVNLRLKLEISELLAEVNDFLWQYHGRPQYIIRKLQFCPWTILKDDLDQLRALFERAPNLEQLTKCRQLVIAQSSNENKHRVVFLERGIENVKKVKESLVELVARVQSQLSSIANISPTLSTARTISAVKFASAGTSGKPKSSSWVRYTKASDTKTALTSAASVASEKPLSAPSSASQSPFCNYGPKLVVKLKVDMKESSKNDGTGQQQLGAEVLKESSPSVKSGDSN